MGATRDYLAPPRTHGQQSIHLAKAHVGWTTHGPMSLDSHTNMITIVFTDQQLGWWSGFHMLVVPCRCKKNQTVE